MNKNKLKYLASTALVFLVTSKSAQAEAFQNFAIGPKIGTQGIGLEAKTQVADNVFARLGVNYTKHKADKKINNINAKGSFKSFTVPLMLDYHPFADSGFRLSFGAAYNNSEINLSGYSTDSVTINGRTYTSSQVGTAKAKVKTGSKLAGLATLGYDSALVNSSRMHFNFEAGVMYTAAPKVSVSATGQLSSNSQMLEDLKKDANSSLRKGKRLLRLFPVLSIGFKYSL
ncbi:MAG: hypothetical protein K0R02_1041 [Rickettsiaceae bacterium]|jgi:hypothetical protein|nr:hypothetical protein [Rickettsiaceae bacterium]